MALVGTSAPFQQVNMPALDLRRYLSVLVASEGVAGLNDMVVAQRAAGANMSVDIAAGEAYVQGDAVANQGMYLGLNDAVYNLTGFTAAHATLPRVDRVALRIRDAFHGDAANDWAFVILTGTATSGATLANTSGAASVGNGHLLLANVLIPATATTITTANIDTTGASNNSPPVRPLIVLAGPTVPAVRVYHNAAQSIGNAADVALVFNSERYDTNGMHDTSTNTNRLTCNLAGVYDIFADIEFAGSSGGTNRDLRIRLNGTTWIAWTNRSATLSSVAARLYVSTTYQLAANDYIEAVVLQDSGGGLNVNSVGNYSPEFGMTKVA